MAYKVIILYQLYMPSYFLGTFTEYPNFMTIPAIKILKQQKSRIDPSFCFKFSCNNRVTFTEITAKKFDFLH